MNYAGLNSFDIANGAGVRVSLFVSGCKLHCDGCFNRDAQDFCYGAKYDEFVETRILAMLNKPWIQGLSILGGDPMCQSEKDTETLSRLVWNVHQLHKDVWLWTGYQFLDVLQYGSDAQYDLLTSCDVVVDGPFVLSRKDQSLAFRGSSNQRVIDVQKSIANGMPIQKYIA